jgi:ABC-2 type transport system permease protein
MGIIFLIGALSMGIFISTICRTQLASSQMAMVSTFLPSFLLSGFMSPIVIMPKLIQLISFAVPARYFIFLLRAIYLKGVGIRVLAFETMLLSIFAMIMFTLAIRKFKKKLE